MEIDNRKCRECGEQLRGRSDQKFCSDQCRTTYNNQLNRDVSNQVRNVNNILRRNRRILENLSKNEKKRIQRELLIQLGFNFSFHTSTFTNKNGQTYYFCYERGYVQLNEDFYFIVRNEVF
ncbi:MAG: hypothetical protein RH860_10180 [Cytophagales bacterium]